VTSAGVHIRSTERNHEAKSEIDAGICGFHTTLRAQSEDDQFVTFDVETDCEKISLLGERLKTLSTLDAFEEINPASGSRLMETVRATLPGCCAGCAVPVGLFKAMQVAAGLALAKDISIQVRTV
jgi:hypothetical protein